MGRLSVMIEDITGNKEQKGSLPDNVPVGRLLEKLITMLELPATGPDNAPMSYRMIHKTSGNTLNEQQTLKQAGVKEDDQLRIQPEITAESERTNELEAAVILHEQQIQELENENRHLEALVDELSGENFLIHTVTRGETLWSISRDYYDDPLQYRILMELNQIEDPDNLEVGRRLLVINPAE
jgi:LysM repeat protein